MLNRRQIPISLVLSLLMALASQAAVNTIPTIEARGGLLFKSVAQVAFSESTWTLPCPVWLNTTDSYAKQLKNWATKQIITAQKGGVLET